MKHVIRNPIPTWDQINDQAAQLRETCEENQILKQILLSASVEAKKIQNAKESLKWLGLKIASIGDDKRRIEWIGHLDNYLSIVSLLDGKFPMLTYYQDLCERYKIQNETLQVENSSLKRRLQLEYQLTEQDFLIK